MHLIKNTIPRNWGYQLTCVIGAPYKSHQARKMSSQAPSCSFQRPSSLSGAASCYISERLRGMDCLPAGRNQSIVLLCLQRSRPERSMHVQPGPARARCPGCICIRRTCSPRHRGCLCSLITSFMWLVSTGLLPGLRGPQPGSHGKHSSAEGFCTTKPPQVLHTG